MIEGVVSGKDAVINLVVRGFNEQEAQIQAVIDTGFSEGISLTADIIKTLYLPFTGDVATYFADGQERITPTYAVVVEWDGVERIVTVVGADAEPLVGMALMEGYNLSIDVTEGGAVRLSRLGGELLTVQGSTVQGDLESST